jgi:hypothetical protein
MGGSGRSGLIVASLLTALAASAAGCGGGSSGTASCTVSQDEGSLGLIKICIEAPASAFSQGCEPASSTGDAGIAVSAVDGPCSRLGALGGCRIAGSGVSETVWYYAEGGDASGGPMSSDIQMLCAEAQATFVAP